ncbi:MAG: endolytic transglycosylase MltG [Alloprevotella sp.]
MKPLSSYSRRQKTWLGIVFALLLLLTATAYALFSSFTSSDASASVYVREGDTAVSVMEQLEPLAGNSLKMQGVKLLSLVAGYASHVHAGKFQVGNGASAFTIVRNLRGNRQETVKLVIVPCIRKVEDLAGRFSASLAADSLQLLATFTDTTLLKKYGMTPQTAIALFIPNTYECYWNISPEALLEKMGKAHQNFWTQQRQADAEAQGLTPNEVVTLASIVEQETAYEPERNAVAGMYLNRLRQGMKLQADPTVKYALNDFSLKRIMHHHLTADSPYNTYRVEGLPPGPICIPSVSSVEAVLHPAQHSYIYMCASPDFSGKHCFATTYAEHLDNARKYAEALDQRNIK